MDFSTRVKTFLKTGKINTYAQLKKYLLEEKKDNIDISQALARLSFKEREELLSEVWDSISNHKKKILVSHLYLDNWNKLIDRYDELKEDEQVKTLEILGYISHPDLINFLLEQMKSKKESIRLTASTALKNQDPQLILEPILLALTQPDQWLPSRVFEVLTCIGPDLNKHLIEMVDKVDVQVQEIIVQVLGEIGDKSCLAVFEKLAKISEGNLRKRIAEALRELKIRQSWPILIKLMDENEWQTRMLAVQALGQLGIAETIPLLEQRKNLETDPIVKECIIDAISQIEEVSLPVAVSWVREG